MHDLQQFSAASTGKKQKNKSKTGKKAKLQPEGKKKKTTNKSREMENVSLGGNPFGPLFVQKRNYEMAPVCHSPSPERWMTKFLVDAFLPAGRTIWRRKKKKKKLTGALHMSYGT